jgi:hypothetical protein
MDRQPADPDRLQVFLGPSSPVLVVDLARCDDSGWKCRCYRLPRIVAGLLITEEDCERIAVVFHGGRRVVVCNSECQVAIHAGK